MTATFSVLDTDTYETTSCTYCGGTVAFDPLSTNVPRDHRSPKGHICPASGLSLRRLQGKS